MASKLRALTAIAIACAAGAAPKNSAVAAATKSH